jgi:beta-glucanase (GH16 family)
MTYKLLWEDNFDKDGKPSDSIWNLETGGYGFGNNEFQYYTEQSKNAFIQNGILNIVSYKETYENRGYTSAKLTTKNKKSIKYGKIEVSAKIPEGFGTWPAIWLLGNNMKEVGWPLCGEIDMMEHVGRNPNHIHFSLHTKTFNFHQKNQRTEVVEVPDLFNGFHEYAIEWTENDITFFLDQKQYQTFSKKPNDTSAEWPFNQGFYLILNLAIGGNWGGAVDDSIFPSTMQFKYVRVYERSE